MQAFSEIDRGYSVIPASKLDIDDPATWSQHLRKPSVLQTCVTSVNYLGVTFSLRAGPDGSKYPRLNTGAINSEKTSEHSNTVSRCDGSIGVNFPVNSSTLPNSESTSSHYALGTNEEIYTKCADRESDDFDKVSKHSEDKFTVRKRRRLVLSKSFFNLRRKHECLEFNNGFTDGKRYTTRNRKSQSASTLLTSYKRKEFDIDSRPSTSSVDRLTSIVTRGTHSSTSSCEQSACDSKDSSSVVTVKSEPLGNNKVCSSDTRLDGEQDKGLLTHPLEKLINRRLNRRHKKKCAFSFTSFLCGCSRRRSFR